MANAVHLVRGIKTLCGYAISLPDQSSYMKVATVDVERATCSACLEVAAEQVEALLGNDTHGTSDSYTTLCGVTLCGISTVNRPGLKATHLISGITCKACRKEVCGV